MQVSSNSNRDTTCKLKKSTAGNPGVSNTEQLTRKQRSDISWNPHQKKETHEGIIDASIEIKKHVRDDDRWVINIEIIPPDSYLITHSAKPVKHVQKNKTKQKSKLPLVLSAGIATTLIISSILTLPNPFNYIIAIAICGPLSASMLGLRK